ncbi:helix-turn-helix domain-containing protein [Streptosporangium sp. NBC_01755]|uniref:helix-turn-helix domain-containing protein n=1 Tax=unclassified Streptosporangium TaxID=2632669 RepID=UPI002DD8CAFF|nr:MULTISPECIES: helix-turn-helix domain-containing protein [unclassified Streptosporangium]WSA22948.1 helix-turn-helix domain-containing protein [Streptosporangium sp. NBC_01810]WSC98909.1 helix-turn-helix domain-containing protein [Streptosporangium sp. NBC_01755]
MAAILPRLPEARLVETRQRGWVDPYAGLNAFNFARQAPSPEISAYVDHFWVVTWTDLAEPYEQRIVSHPTVNMTITPNFHRIAGVIKGGFSYTMRGSGRVLGTRFRPGGFRPFLGGPVSQLTGRFVEIDEMYGAAGATLVEQVLAEPDTRAAIALTETFLLSLRPDQDPPAEEVAALVAMAESDVSVTRVDELAARSGRSVRSLQRLFRDHVGIGPKWVIRRFRLHEAAERVYRGLDLATLAAELGYTDQAHLTRDFTAAVGMPPAAYARLRSQA